MSASTPAPSSLPTHSHLRLVFIGRNGLRAGWHLAIFLLIFATLVAVPALVLGHFMPQIPAWAKSQPVDTFHPGYLMFFESWLALFLFLAAFVMSKIEKRTLSDYGLPTRGAFRRKFSLGLAAGLGGVSLEMALIAAFGGYSFGSPGLGWDSALKYGLLWGAVFLVAGVQEEFLFRGYLQRTLSSGIGFWPAAVILSVGFAALHVGNPGERWPGTVMLFCFGMLASFTLERTGSLWFIIGLHAAWDWAHVFLFSVPIAGMSGAPKLLHSSLHGPTWLTGASVGPDGSVFAFVVLLAITLVVCKRFINYVLASALER